MLWMLPTAWWSAIWPRGVLRQLESPRLALREIVLFEYEIRRSPPPVAVVRDDTRTEAADDPADDPDWWWQSWRVRIAVDFGTSHATIPDTLIPLPLQDLLGARATLDLILASPDSVIQARIWELVAEGGLRLDDVSGMFESVARARAYVDMQRRQAATFGEFGADQVRVPD